MLLVLGWNTGLKEFGGNCFSSGGLDAWMPLVLGWNTDTLVGAVFVDGVELLGGVTYTVVVVMVMVDDVHVVVVDVRALKYWVA